MEKIKVVAYMRFGKAEDANLFLPFDSHGYAYVRTPDKQVMAELFHPGEGAAQNESGKDFTAEKDDQQ